MSASPLHRNIRNRNIEDPRARVYTFAELRPTANIDQWKAGVNRPAARPAARPAGRSPRSRRAPLYDSDKLQWTITEIRKNSNMLAWINEGSPGGRRGAKRFEKPALRAGNGYPEG